jgi:4-amino-4-deoxy-L-arabinose transferase-like glycosyltransferase
MNRFPRLLIALLLISLAVRLTWAAIQPSTDAQLDRLPDQREYLSLGRNLLHDGSLSFVDTRFDQRLYAYRSPGYPAFIALLGGSPLAVRLLQALLDTSTILAVYLLAQQLTRQPAFPIYAALLIAVDPFLIYFTGLILSETLFTALLIWGVFLLVRRRTLIAAILLLLAALVRPSAILLAPILILFIPAHRVRELVIVIAVMVIGLFPWAWRNHRAVGAWVWTTTNSGITLYDGFNPAASGASDQRFVTQMPQLQPMNEVKRSRYLQQSARTWITEHLSALPSLTLIKIARTWSPIPLSSEFGRPLYRIVSAAYTLPLDVLVLIGLFSKSLNRREKMLLVIPAIYFTILCILSVGSLRYRIPAEPLLVVIAAAALSDLKHRFFPCPLR